MVLAAVGVGDRGDRATFRSAVLSKRETQADQAVYVGMRLYDDDPSGIAAQLAWRDATGIHSDWAHVLIDSYHDHRTAFRFSVNPVGVQKDDLYYADFSEDVNRDGVWEVATAMFSARRAPPRAPGPDSPSLPHGRSTCHPQPPPVPAALLPGGRR